MSENRNIDSFGHHGNLPQILLKSGMRNYLFQRPGQHEKILDRTLFQWEGIDGSQVPAFRALEITTEETDFLEMRGSTHAASSKCGVRIEER